jgi:alcohol dehydrogenase
VPHGEAVAMMLPHVIRHNGQRYGKGYYELMQSGRPFDDTLTVESAPAVLADWITQVAREAGLTATLKESGVVPDRVPVLAAAASQQWTIKFNPVELSVADCQRLYESAL